MRRLGVRRERQPRKERRYRMFISFMISFVCCLGAQTHPRKGKHQPKHNMIFCFYFSSGLPLMSNHPRPYCFLSSPPLTSSLLRFCFLSRSPTRPAGGFQRQQEDFRPVCWQFFRKPTSDKQILQIQNTGRCISSHAVPHEDTARTTLAREGCEMGVQGQVKVSLGVFSDV